MNIKICPQCGVKNAIGNSCCRKCGCEIMAHRIEPLSLFKRGSTLSIHAWEGIFSPAFYFGFALSCLIIFYILFQQYSLDLMRLFQI